MKYIRYDRDDILSMPNHTIVWNCNFKPIDARESTKKYSYTLIKGMVTINNDIKTEQGDNPTHNGFYQVPRYFIPFKKNAKGCDLEDLAWSKAVRIHNRHVYADTEAECIEAYNEYNMKHIKNLIILAKEYANNITDVTNLIILAKEHVNNITDITDADKTLLEKLNNM